MTAQEIQKRNGKAQKLRVLKVDEETFYVESGEGKICYKVTISDKEIACACSDFTRGIKSDPKFRCKHIMSVLSCNVKEIEQAEILEKRSSPKLDPRFIITLNGKDYCQYAGLLDLAHQKGLLKIEVSPVQFPSKENGNFAICKAIAESSNGEIFTDVGDANESNCNSRVSKHLLRMASTRAKARALRDMTNIGMTCLEELDTADLGENGSIAQSKPETRKTPVRKANDKREDPKTQTPKKEAPIQESTASTKTNAKKEEKTDPGNGSKQGNQNGTPGMSEAQRRAVYNLSRRRGISVGELDKMVQEAHQTTLENLSSKDASTFIRQLQTSS